MFDFRSANSDADIANLIGIDVNVLRLYIHSESKSNFYKVRELPKKSRLRKGEFRIVYDVKSSLLHNYFKKFTRRFELFARIVEIRHPHIAAFGYVRHKGARDNAAIHCGAKYALKADIENFFPSISKKRVFDLFRTCGIEPEPADVLAEFVTIDGKLPLGLNSSPMLANLICLDLDDALQNISQKYNCRYTRYADDITISGNKDVPSRGEIEGIILDHGFRMSHRKFRVTKPGQAHYVTGLSITDPAKPHAPKAMKRRVRQEIYYCNKFGIAEHVRRTCIKSTVQSQINRIDGTIRYVDHVEGGNESNMSNAWKDILNNEGRHVSYPDKTKATPNNMVCVIDESIIFIDGVRYFALCICFVDDANAITATLAGELHNAILDPFYAGDKDALIKSGIHFTEIHPDLRISILRRVSEMPVRAYIQYMRFHNHIAYKDAYLQCLKARLEWRLISCNGNFLDVYIEENSSVRESDVISTINECYSFLTSIESKRPILNPRVKFVSKKEYPMVAIPDAILWTWGRYAAGYERVNNKSREYRIDAEGTRLMQFERIRDSIRETFDIDAKKAYSRRFTFFPIHPEPKDAPPCSPTAPSPP